MSSRWFLVGTKACLGMQWARCDAHVVVCALLQMFQVRYGVDISLISPAQYTSENGCDCRFNRNQHDCCTQSSAKLAQTLYKLCPFTDTRIKIKFTDNPDLCRNTYVMSYSKQNGLVSGVKSFNMYLVSTL